jgi:hypothetical protein
MQPTANEEGKIDVKITVKVGPFFAFSLTCEGEEVWKERG